jgi:hypothetical protein
MAKDIDRPAISARAMENLTDLTSETLKGSVSEPGKPDALKWYETLDKRAFIKLTEQYGQESVMEFIRIMEEEKAKEA